MRRKAIGAIVGLATLIGSALAAEAQQITPTGPLSVVGGATSSTYTANIYLPSPCAYVVRLWVYRAGIEVHYSMTVHANPGTVNSVFEKIAVYGAQINAGDVLTFKATLKVGTTIYNAQDWVVTVSGTRPSKTLQKSTTLALQSVDRDRRRE
jgi:hypothetical protein